MEDEVRQLNVFAQRVNSNLARRDFALGSLMRDWNHTEQLLAPISSYVNLPGDGAGRSRD